jgi:osmotically-inducible protein OsmY
MKRPWIPFAAAAALASMGPSSAFAQATVVSPAASGAISGPHSGTNAVNPAPSGVRKGTGDVTDNRGSTSFGGARASADDGALLGSVASALASDPALRGAQLQVEVDRGVVGVTGHVRDSAQATRVGQVAAEAARGARVETDVDFE